MHYMHAKVETVLLPKLTKNYQIDKIHQKIVYELIVATFENEIIKSVSKNYKLCIFYLICLMKGSHHYTTLNARRLYAIFS